MNDTNDQNYIRALERENTELKAEVKRLKITRADTSPPPRQEKTRDPLAFSRGVDRARSRYPSKMGPNGNTSYTTITSK